MHQNRLFLLLVASACPVFGELVTWGDPLCKPETDAAVALPELKQIVSITSTTSSEPKYRDGMFAAIKADGTVVAWGGYARFHPSADTYAKLVNVVNITAAARAFAALKSDSTVVEWGDAMSGGSSGVQSQLVDVVSITANDEAFAALKSDGSVVCWGDWQWGGRDGDQGCTRPTSYNEHTSIQSQLVSITSIIAVFSGFVALKNDGTVVSWGGWRSGQAVLGVSDATLANVASLWPSASSFRPTSSHSSNLFVVIKDDGKAVSVPAKPNDFWAEVDGVYQKL